MIRRTLTVLAAFGVALPAALVAGSPAQAHHSNCPYPYVCLWDVRTSPDTRYTVRAFGYTNLPVGNVVDHVYNTRNDDSAILWDYGTQPNTGICIAPHQRADLAPRWHNRVDMVEIRDNPSCAGLPRP
jgi:hypothetical protein